MIFTYRDSVSEKLIYTRKGHVNSIKEVILEMPNEYRDFFKDERTCPSCNKVTENVFKDTATAHYGKDLFLLCDVWECATCGWWELMKSSSEESDLIDEVDSYHEETLYRALLKSFKVGAKTLPIPVLFDELKKNPDVMYKIHSKKMEELVQSVFSQFFKCEVSLVGKSGDGGIDLIMINNDSPTLIQVKRRTKKNAVEGISTVRDLLGTLFIEDACKGIIVSTANHFSNVSHKVKNKLLEENKLESFELYDFKRFNEMLQLTNDKKEEAWRKLL